MEMDLEANRETIGFKNFPIRDFVTSIRKKDPEKCWPFASLCAYKGFAESMKLAILNGSEDGEAPELSEGEISMGKEAGSDTRTGFELEIPTVNETGSEIATGFELEISKGKEIATRTARAVDLEVSKGNTNGFETAAGNVDIEHNSDDNTLGSFLKKRKGIKVSRRAKNKKKQKRLQIGKPKPEAVKRPNHGPEGSRTMTKKSKSADIRNCFATERLAEALRSVEMETKMAKSKRSMAPGAPGGARGLGLSGSGAGGSTGSRMGAGTPCEGRFLMVMVNRNPADFCAPGDGNGFMRRGYSE